MALSDREKRDASDLAAHLIKSRITAARIDGRQPLVLAVGLCLMIAGAAGLLFRQLAHEELTMILGAMVIAGVLAALTWLDERRRMRRAEVQAIQLYDVARERAYPVGHDGAYLEPGLQPDDWHSSHYGR